MTVASLWKVLDNAGCGVAVGEQDLVNGSGPRENLTNPWNFNESNDQSSPKKRPALAVDLSIWICEGLTSPGMAQNHANPALHLAYTRSMKLLSLGIKLVIVVEGKRRVRQTEEPDKFHKRRSGTAFWKACGACEQMFEAMGVPVVKAKAEGEALCALLNQRGVVDGVISNDGDCLLFGAKIVYTKFSIENLSNSQVFRYDSSDLKAVVESESDEKRDGLENSKISLSRTDLISFALLSGSDLAGSGLPKIGHKKAARFLFKCKHDHPLSKDTAAIDELHSWAQTAHIVHASSCEEGIGKEKERCCSTCNHAGDKRSHLKNGCEICGTEAGEACYQFTGSDRFRLGLRQKALSIKPQFAPTMVVDAYLKPNDNQLPMVFEDTTSTTLQMGIPSIGAFLATGLVVKGQSFAVSREFTLGTLSRLMIRRDLFSDTTKEPTRPKKKRTLSKEVPVAEGITRELVKDKVQCFEVQWSVQATVTDSDGIGIDGYKFSSVEPQESIHKAYPSLVTSFLELCVEREKQGDTERVKRKDFIQSLLNIPRDDDDDHSEGREDKNPRKRGGKKRKIHDSFFENNLPIQHAAKRPHIKARATNEIKAMMRDGDKARKKSDLEFDHSTIATGSLVFHIGEPKKKKKQYGRPRPRLHEVQPLGMTITVFKPPTQAGQPTSERDVTEDDSVKIIEQPSRKVILVETKVETEGDLSPDEGAETPVVLLARHAPNKEAEIVHMASKRVIEQVTSKREIGQVAHSSQMSPMVFQRDKQASLETTISRSPVCWTRHAVVDLPKPFQDRRKTEHLQPAGERNSSSKRHRESNENIVEANALRAYAHDLQCHKERRKVVIDLSKTFPEGRKTGRVQAFCEKEPFAEDRHHLSKNTIEASNLREKHGTKCQCVHQNAVGVRRLGENLLPELLIEHEVPAGEDGPDRENNPDDVDPTDATYASPKFISRADPDAWMARVVVDDAATHASASSLRGRRVNRRLEYSSVAYTGMPTLSSGRNNFVICDLGIPIPVTPLVSTK
jgi:hypothetical protein